MRKLLLVAAIAACSATTPNDVVDCDSSAWANAWQSTGATQPPKTCAAACERPIMPTAATLGMQCNADYLVDGKPTPITCMAYGVWNGAKGCCVHDVNPDIAFAQCE